jgi:hypothetical protein
MDNPASPAESPHGRIGIAAGVAIGAAFELVGTAVGQRPRPRPLHARPMVPRPAPWTSTPSLRPAPPTPRRNALEPIPGDFPARSDPSVFLDVESLWEAGS